LFLLHVSWLESILDLIFPETQVCTFCWTEIEGRGSRGICSKCAKEILGMSERFVTCSRCGHFIIGKTCPNCYDWTFEIDGVLSVVPYEGVYKEKIFDLKYNGKKELAVALGYLMACRAKHSLLEKRDIYVVPIPLHPLREEERGYNQSALLARVVARELNCRYEESMLRRRNYEKSQTFLGRKERRANIKSAFEVTSCGILKAQNILLVDDILTTGATMVSAAAVLRKAGAKRIFGLTWATGFDKQLFTGQTFVEISRK